LVKWCISDDGEIHEKQPWHQSIDEVREFYAQFSGEVIVGFETSGYSSWFEAMEELGHQVWIGHATEIRKRVRSQQKTDRRDAELILDLLIKDEFPRIHRVSAASREVFDLGPKLIACRRLLRPGRLNADHKEKEKQNEGRHAQI
jgi:transposase